MKKLLLLLALISSISFGIEKKTPTGGTVKDKPGKSQSSITADVNISGTVIRPATGGYYYSNRSTATPGTNTYAVLNTIKLNKGVYILFASLEAYPSSGTKRIKVGFSIGTGSTSNLTGPGGGAYVNSSYESGSTWSGPVIITSDGVDVNLIGACYEGGGIAASASEFTAIKLRDL